MNELEQDPDLTIDIPSPSIINPPLPILPEYNFYEGDVRDAEVVNGQLNACLGEDVYCNAEDFQGEKYMHIRKYESLPGFQKATEKGVGLNMDNVIELLAVKEDIEEAV